MRAHVVLVADELRQVQYASCCKSLARPCAGETARDRVRPSACGQLRQHPRLGRLQDAIEAAKDGERQDDFAVVGLLVVAPQQVRDGPNEGGKRLVVQTVYPPANQSRYPAEPKSDGIL